MLAPSTEELQHDDVCRTSAGSSHTAKQHTPKSLLVSFFYNGTNLSKMSTNRKLVITGMGKISMSNFKILLHYLPEREKL
jgi:hypothetical protein